MSGGGVTGAPTAGKLATLLPQQADACGAEQASQERLPWNLARRRSSNPARWHGSLQLVVNPVNTGWLHPPHDGAGAGAQAGAGAHTGAGAQAGTGSQAGAHLLPNSRGRAAQLARSRSNSPTRGAQGSHDDQVGAGAPHPPQPVAVTVIGAGGAGVGGGAGSAPRATAALRNRNDALMCDWLR